MKDETDFQNEVDTIAQLAERAGGVEIENVTLPKGFVGLPAEVPLALIRGDNPQVKAIDNVLEQYRIHPARKKGTAIAQTFASFCELTNRHKTDDSAIFADMDWRKPSLTTVVDYHPDESAGDADWLQHRIHYAYPLSDEWKAWMEADGKAMEQKDFAWFLEDRVPELSAPTDEEKIRYERDFATTIATPSQVVELSRGLQVNVAAQVKAATTLQSGEGEIRFVEEHQGADGKPLKVPGIFILSIAPFFMGEKVRIPVRLRYRITGGKTVWFYQVYRPDQFITEHVRATLFDAAAKTELPTFEGKPEA